MMAVLFGTPTELMMLLFCRNSLVKTESIIGLGTSLYARIKETTHKGATTIKTYRVDQLANLIHCHAEKVAPLNDALCVLLSGR